MGKSSGNLAKREIKSPGNGPLSSSGAPEASGGFTSPRLTQWWSPAVEAAGNGAGSRALALHHGRAAIPLPRGAGALNLDSNDVRPRLNLAL